jgi:hypothetical protein
MSKRRGQYDLEDEFLWFEQELSKDTDWIKTKGGSTVTVCEDPRYSTIVLDCPNYELFNEKQYFAEICEGEEWMPKSAILKLNRNGTLTLDSETALWTMQDYQLLFLKKAGPGIGGGFDVTPIIPRKGELDEQVMNSIIKQNANLRYRRDVFILQAGVANPLQTHLGQKIDLRLYMLIVGDITGKIAFYACRVGDIRNTAAYPYKPSSVDVRLQITNVAQNRKSVDDTSEITRVFSEDETPLWYEKIFSKFLVIAERIGILYESFLRVKDPRRQKAFVTLIGLDAVVDEMSLEPMIVEINRRPTVYTPQEAAEMQYSSTLFMHDVFTLGIEALANGQVGKTPPLTTEFILVH